jgi:DNA-binding MarR family transcriptional regulator
MHNLATAQMNTKIKKKEELIQEIIFQIRRLVQAREHHTKELNKQYQVSTPQLNCLLALYEKGPLPPSRIAKEVLVESSTVTGIIDRLEQKGFVRRVRSAQDRRKIFIELTESGQILAESAPPLVQQKIYDGLKDLEGKNLEVILEGLSRLTHLLDN